MKKYKFETYQDRAGEYRWRLRARNGRIVADCAEGYNRRRSRDQILRSIIEATSNGAISVEEIESKTRKK